ncbi:MAG: M20/M25/M40 family metallo-hydrolase [Melioribacteraceae bacterium]
MKVFNKRILFLFFFAITTFNSFAQLSGNYKDGFKYINKDDIEKNVTYLASDDMKGRGIGTSQTLEAAKYIAGKFYDYGLKPYNDIANPPFSKTKKKTPRVFSAEKYLQRFNLNETKLNQTETKLELIKSNSRKTYSYQFKKDFIVDYRLNKNVTIKAQVVFLGYGIEKDGHGYNDYIDADGKPIDVKNKIVLLVEGFPQESDTSSYFFKSKSKFIKSIKQKVATLQEKGALAVLNVQSPLKNQAQFAIKMEPLIKAFTRTDYAINELSLAETIPLIYISKDVMIDMFNGSGKKNSELLKNIDKDLKSASFQFSETEIALNIDFDCKLVETQNVIGFLEGSDPVLKNEYVVVGAHYDHVGLGYYGAMNKSDAGKIHNGADDNASGTSGMVELAEAFSNVKSKRSLIFIAFAAEENGMLGSKHYVYQNPLFPLEKTVGMVNLDMISRNNKRIIWIGGPYYSSDMKLIVEEANKEIGFELLYNVGLYTFASDQAGFIRKNIPSVFLFAGDHDDYHTPNDDVDKCDFEKAESVSKLGYLTAWLLANQNSKPAYRALSIEEKTKLVKDSIEKQRKIVPEKKSIEESEKKLEENR